MVVVVVVLSDVLELELVVVVVSVETVGEHGWVSATVVETGGVLAVGLEAGDGTAGSEIFSLILGATGVTGEGDGGRSSDSD